MPCRLQRPSDSLGERPHASRGLAYDEWPVARPPTLSGRIRARRRSLVVAALCVVAVLVTVGMGGRVQLRPVVRGSVALATPSPRQSPTPGIAQEAAPEPAPPSATTATARGGVVVPILLYHYIRINPVPTDRVGFNLSVTPQHFAQQMQLLHDAGAHAITLADLMHSLTTGAPLPPHPVVLTFDDGYADFATVAAPIMATLGLRATDFVVSGFIGRPNYMTAQQILQVQAMGMVIGCHTVHHVALAHVPLAVARVEIDLARLQLQQLTHTSVDDFAYPYGDFDTAVVGLVEQAGFRDAVTTLPGIVHTLAQRFVLTRERIGGTDTLASFAAKAHVPLVPLHPPPSLASLERQSQTTTAPIAGPRPGRGAPTAVSSLPRGNVERRGLM